MSSEIISGGTYHIVHKGGLYVVPRTPEETVSPLCVAKLADPNFPPLAYVWRFFEIETDLYRIVNEKTQKCVQIKHGDLPPVAGESVHQNTCGIGSADERWYYRGGRFECFLNPNLMWEPVNPGEEYPEIMANPVHGVESEWILVTTNPTEETAKGTGA